MSVLDAGAAVELERACTILRREQDAHRRVLDTGPPLGVWSGWLLLGVLLAGGTYASGYPESATVLLVGVGLGLGWLARSLRRHRTRIRRADQRLLLARQRLNLASRSTNGLARRRLAPQGPETAKEPPAAGPRPDDQVRSDGGPSIEGVELAEQSVEDHADGDEADRHRDQHDERHDNRAPEWNIFAVPFSLVEQTHELPPTARTSAPDRRSPPENYCPSLPGT